MGVNRDAMAVRDASAGYDFKTGKMAVPSGYKWTEEGVIPGDWELKRIGDIATVFSGGTPKRKTAEYWGGDVPWITTTLIAGGEIRQANEFITVTGVEESSAKWCKAGTILMAMYGQGKTRGKVAILGIEATINQACAAIELKDSSSSEYVLHVLNYMYEDIRELSNSGGQENLSGGIIRRIRIPFPIEPEQRAIATALSDVDALLEGLDRLIAKKRDLKQAAMQQLLTGQTRLPGFEGEWVVKQLADLAQIVMGQSPNSSNYNLKGDGLPLIQGNADIRGRKTIKRVFTTQITKQGRAGDILMSVRAPVGEISRATFDVCLGRGVCALRAANDFLYHYLIYVEPSWAKHSKGSTFDSVNSSDIKSVEVRLPNDPGEQSAIATVLSDMDAELEALEQRHAKTAALKQAMMQELLTGRTRLVTPEAGTC